MQNSLVIAIDGPSASGKSTVARSIANQLNIVYIDTGAMYRAVGYVCQQREIEFSENEQLHQFLKTVKIEYGVSKDCLISIDGEDLTKTIREHYVSSLASKISQIPSVRTFLVDFQREIGSSKFSVMEGRDIGTVVFPDAFCKIYLTASSLTRAKRRLSELKNEMSLEEMIKDVEGRDHADMTRATSPLKQADDAIKLDSSDLTQEEVILNVISIAKNQANSLGLNL